MDRLVAKSLVLVACAGATAQSKVYVPDAAASSGPINLVPLGGKAIGPFQDIKTHIRVPARFLPRSGATITDIGFAAGDKGDYSYARMTISCAHLKGSSLSAKFADNLDGPVQVLNAPDFRYRFTSKDAFWPVGLTGAFRHDGSRDIVVEVVMQGAFFSSSTPGSRRSSTLETVYALAWDPKKPQASGYGPFDSGAKLMLVLQGAAVVYFGTGCKGSNGKTPSVTCAPPRIGKTWQIDAADALGGAGALLMLGTSDRRWGTIPLPLDLTGAGAPGCKLLTDPWFLLTGATSASGAVRMLLPVPNDPKLPGARLFVQWALGDAKVNTLGLSFTRGARTTLQ